MSRNPTRIDFDKLRREDEKFARWQAHKARKATQSPDPRGVRSEPYPQAEPERALWGVWLMWALVIAVLVVGVVVVIEMV